MLTIGLHTVVVRGPAVEEDGTKDLSSQDIRVAVEQRARLNVTELFRVTLNAVVLTARGLGTPGVLARMRHIAMWNVATNRLNGAKREVATLECKLRCFLLLLPLSRCSH